nr:glycosyltransferase family 4 protein [Arthrobacter sp. ISL-72]
MRHSRKVLVLGSAWRDFVTQELGCNPDASVILANAVPGPQTIPVRPQVPTNILFTGRIGKRKGILELLDAVGRLPQSSNWTLALAGDVTEDDIALMLDDAPENVTVLGWLSQDELKDVLHKSSIFVLPSHAEGLPLSLLDAMAWGLAPVVTAVGSIEDVVVHREDSLIVDVGDVVSICESLNELILNPALVEELGSAARSKWELGYSISDYRERLDNVYDLCLEGDQTHDIRSK